MTEEEKPDWKVILSEQAQAELDANPEIAAQVRELSSRLRQVMGEVEAGRIGSVEEALRSLGMEPVSVDELVEQGIIGPHVSSDFTPKKALSICRAIFDLMHDKKLNAPEVFLTATLVLAIIAKVSGVRDERLHLSLDGAVNVIDGMLTDEMLRDLMNQKAN